MWIQNYELQILRLNILLMLPANIDLKHKLKGSFRFSSDIAYLRNLSNQMSLFILVAMHIFPDVGCLCNMHTYIFVGVQISTIDLLLLGVLFPTHECTLSISIYGNFLIM